MDPVIEHLRNAIDALCAERLIDAEQELRTIGFAGLLQKRATAYSQVWGPTGLAAGFKRPSSGIKRTAPRAADINATFLRDCYTCRYSHCRRSTVSVRVLRLLSAAFPEVLPYHRNWRPLDRCILYWTYSASLEHLISFPAGGTSAAENLVTACYQCNDIKNYLPLELLGWQVTAPPKIKWAGLTEYIPQLQAALLTCARSKPANGPNDVAAA